MVLYFNPQLNSQGLVTVAGGGTGAATAAGARTNLGLGALAVQSGAYVTYTPTVSAFSGDIGPGITASGQYTTVGDTIFFDITCSISPAAAGTGNTALMVSVPSAVAGTPISGWGVGRETAVGSQGLIGYINGAISSTKFVIQTAGGGYPVSAGGTIGFGGSYRIA